MPQSEGKRGASRVVNGGVRKPQNGSRDRDDVAHKKAIGQLKTQIRNTTRLLSHADNMPADLRIIKERALLGYKADLEAAQNARRRSEMIGKYHMVRFFERQRATRVLKKIEKALAKSSPGSEEYAALDRKRQVAETDLNYAIYHPLMERYISLYPKEKREDKSGADDQLEGDDDEDTSKSDAQAEKPPMWHRVAEAMQNGTLQQLRDSGGLQNLSSQDFSSVNIAPSQQRQEKSARQKEAAREKAEARLEEKMAGLNRRERRKLIVAHRAKMAEQDEDSDGGFFER